MNQELNIKIGYEIECVHNLAPSTTVKTMCKELGLPYHLNESYGFEGLPYSNWVGTYDSSIRTYYDDHGVEMISPVMDYDYGIELLPKIFNWMNDNGITTNSSTGFHVGLSVVDAMHKIDPFKLVLLLDEANILKMFGRENSRYCRNHKRAIIENQVYDNRLSSKDDINYWLLNSTTKYNTVNFVKLKSRTPYLEFRALGGEYYHNRFDDIHLCIDHFKDCLESSIIPDMREEEYNSNLKQWQERNWVRFL